MARCLLAVTLTLVAGCDFRVLALPIDGAPDLASASDVDLGGVVDPGGGGGADLATVGPVAGADLAGATGAADLAVAPTADLATPPPDLATAQGLLSGTRDAIPPGVVDLTAEGTVDWAHFGLAAATDVDHKAGVTPQIAIAASVPLAQFGTYAAKMKWGNGTPTQKANTSSGVYVHGAGSVITLSVPATTTTRSLRLYLTNFNSTGRLVAHLSDGSAADYAQTLQTGPNSYYRVTLTFHAASAGQTLTVTWTLQTDAGTGSVDALAATLF